MVGIGNVKTALMVAKKESLPKLCMKEIIAKITAKYHI